MVLSIQLLENFIFLFFGKLIVFKVAFFLIFISSQETSISWRVIERVVLPLLSRASHAHIIFFWEKRVIEDVEIRLCWFLLSGSFFFDLVFLEVIVNNHLFLIGLRMAIEVREFLVLFLSFFLLCKLGWIEIFLGLGQFTHVLEIFFLIRHVIGRRGHFFIIFLFLSGRGIFGGRFILRILLIGKLHNNLKDDLQELPNVRELACDHSLG